VGPAGLAPGSIFLHMPVPSWSGLSGQRGTLAACTRASEPDRVNTCDVIAAGALLYTTQLYQDVENPGAGYHELMARTYPPGIHQTMLFECAAGGWIHISVMSGLPPLKTIDEVIALDHAPTSSPDGPVAAERAELDIRRRHKMRSWDRDELVEELRLYNHAAEAVVPAHDVSITCRRSPTTRWQPSTTPTGAPRARWGSPSICSALPER